MLYLVFPTFCYVKQLKRCDKHICRILVHHGRRETSRPPSGPRDDKCPFDLTLPLPASEIQNSLPLRSLIFQRAPVEGNVIRFKADPGTSNCGNRRGCGYFTNTMAQGGICFDATMFFFLIYSTSTFMFVRIIST